MYLNDVHAVPQSLVTSTTIQVTPTMTTVIPVTTMILVTSPPSTTAFTTTGEIVIYK